MATIAVLGTMDTKGEEHGFVAEQIQKRGHNVLIIDTGTLEPPKLRPDVTRDEVAAFIGQLQETESDGNAPVGRGRAVPVSVTTPDLRRVPAEQLAAELQRRGWIVSEP